MSARIFQGGDTSQVNGLTGAPALAASWYWEPEDYEGDTLWSPPFRTREEAERAAEADAVGYDADPPEVLRGDYERDRAKDRELRGER